ncbi:MAG TPA: non-canonical purine NTP pyrophosphatase [Candidatus Saccharimonadales bacterium]|nr:non-canonical purine NTP pyrophosphatase [Candidatus Saccharimonadales bacterium]
MKEPLIFVTGHPTKAEQISWHINYPIKAHKLDLKEIQSLDPEEVVRAKALEAYEHLHQACLVEDVSLRFTALGKLPGTLIKWFYEELSTTGVCKLLDAYDNREATVSSYFALTTNGSSVQVFHADINGRISGAPLGNNGFLSDSIFIPEGFDITYAQMTEEQQKENSVRRLALQGLSDYLERNPIN